jgi:YesN/AraC family two-component response regulator
MLSLFEGSEDFLADVKICGLIAEMLTEMVLARQHPANGMGLYRHQPEMEAALSHIRLNYARRIGVDDIVAGNSLSKYYFLRLFKSYTGMGLYEYLNNHRVDVAKKLLKSTDNTVGGIALAVGFQDVNCFIRYFKKVTGTTPDVFRRYYLY